MLYHPSPHIRLTLESYLPPLSNPTHPKAPLRTIHQDTFNIPVIQGDTHFLCVDKPPFLRIDAADRSEVTVEQILNDQLVGKSKDVTTYSPLATDFFLNTAALLDPCWLLTADDISHQGSSEHDPLDNITALKQTHQLDANTSGVFLYAKHKVAAAETCRLFEQRKVKKTYLAIVHGHVDLEYYSSYPIPSKPEKPYAISGQSLRIEALIQEISHHRCETVAPPLESTGLAGKGHPQEACTVLTPLSHLYLFESRLPATLVRLDPLTGRRHQLRVHCASIGHAIVGDWEYETVPTQIPKEEGGRMFLHAFQLEMTFPDRGLLDGSRRRNRKGKMSGVGEEVGYVWRSTVPFGGILDDGSNEALKKIL
jgi:tRNA pseudouridine32 synthase/23S rRNA pseudouridine746 synthase